MNKICLGTVFLFAFLTSCIAEENLDDFMENEGNLQVNISRKGQGIEKNDYHVLVIGNSLSRDAFSYVPAIIKDVSKNKKFNFEILYRGNKSLNDHWNSISNEIFDYTLDIYDNDNSKWQTNTKVLAKDIVTSMEWDLVVLQEGSRTACSFDLTQPSVHRIAGYIREIQPNVNIAFMINPPHADGYSDLGVFTSDEVWIQYIKTARRLLGENEIDYIIPCGTGIQNARNTYLDSLGVFGSLSYDGKHLQEGIPCMIDAYVASQALFNFFNINSSIESCNLKITQQWVDNSKIPGQHGKVIEGTDEDYNTSKECAIKAIECPFSLFDNKSTTSIRIPKKE